jgi:hypothetical protein
MKSRSSQWCPTAPGLPSTVPKGPCYPYLHAVLWSMLLFFGSVQKAFVLECWKMFPVQIKFEPVQIFWGFFRLGSQMTIPKTPKSKKVRILKGCFSPFWHLFNIYECSFLSDDPKSQKSNTVRILKDPFQHVKTFSTSFRGVFSWQSPSPRRWGSSKMLFGLGQSVSYQ